MASSPDTLRVSLTGFAYMAWSPALESTFLKQPDLAWLSKFVQPEENFFNYLVIVIKWAFNFRTRNAFCYGPVPTRKV